MKRYLGVAAIAFGAIIPATFLVCQKLPATKPMTDAIGPYYSGIATYVIAGAAMVVGSLLKPHAAEGARA